GLLVGEGFIGGGIGPSPFGADETGQVGEALAPPHPHKATVATFAGRRAANTRRKDKTTPGAYKCDVCGADFTAKHNLKNHQNSHIGLRNYACSTCGQVFGTSGVQKRHERKCAKPGPYSSPVSPRGAPPNRGRRCGVSHVPNSSTSEC
ncbi:hypothetical protein FB451DRAFT_1088199, partial [Mycena latifolia]